MHFEIPQIPTALKLSKWSLDEKIPYIKMCFIVKNMNTFEIVKLDFYGRLERVVRPKDIKRYFQPIIHTKQLEKGKNSVIQKYPSETKENN